MFLLFLALGFFLFSHNLEIEQVKTQLKAIEENEQSKKEIQEQNNSANEEEKSGEAPEILNIGETENKEFDDILKIAPMEKMPSFSQLIGLHREKETLKEIMSYIKNKENFQNIGKFEIPKEILFYGLPGTGKTILARAFSKECNLPMFEISSSLFSQTYKGEAVRMVKELFTKARRIAEEKEGCIIFLDECETIFADLSRVEIGSELSNVVNQFKTELTSTENNPDKPVLVVAATNYEDQIEDAIKSRFVYRVEFFAGDVPTRNAQFNFMIKQRKNPFSQKAKDYFEKVLNPSLDFLSPKEEFKKAYRTLENFLKSSLSTFILNRDKDGNPKEIQPEHLKKAFLITILEGYDESKINSQLATIETNLKSFENKEVFDEINFQNINNKKTKLENYQVILQEIKKLEEKNNFSIEILKPKIEPANPEA